MTDAPQLAPLRRPRIHPYVQAVLVALATLAMIVAVVAGWAVNVSLSSINSSQQAQIAQLSDNNDALRNQVLAQGETPVAPPASTVTGSPGDPGPAGPVGATGQNGRSVSSFACQTDSTWLVTYDDGSRQTIAGPCIGVGIPGINGTNGVNGTNGADGAAGAAGADGQPIVSWTWSWLGANYLCERDDPFDPASPTYHCTIHP